MFLSFSVTGALVRPFMQLLQTVSKQGEGLFFEPRPHLLQLRVVNSSRSTHMLVNIDTCHLEAYRFCANRSGEMTGVTGGNGILSTEAHDNDSNDFYLLLSTKALIATVLRQSQGLCAMHVRYDAASATDMGSCDRLHWECVLSCGIVRTFALPLGEGQPERAYFKPDQFSFDACATAKVWGALLAWFPASRPRVIVQPLKSRLEVWVVNDEELSMMGDRPQSIDGGKGGWTETKVVATQDHFLFLVQHEEDKQKQEQHGGDVTRGTKTLGDEDRERSHTAVKSRWMPLPGKIIEVKPFKQVCLLADQLGMMIRVRMGLEGLPVFVEAITVQEARQAAALVATKMSDSSFFAGDASAASVQNLFGRSSAPLENLLRVTFSMYIAAFDIPQRSVENVEGFTATERYSANSVTTVVGDDRGVIATGTTHEPHGTLATICVTPLSSEPIPPFVTVQRSASAATENMSTAAPIHSTDFACIGGPVVDSSCSPSRVLVSASPTQAPCRTSGGFSIVDVTPFRCGGQTSSPPSGGMVVKATPDVSAVLAPFSAGKRPRGSEETSGNSPQQWIPGSTAVSAISVTPSSSFVMPTGGMSIDRAQQQQQQLSLDSGRASLGTHYPLDFGAFMREIAEKTTDDAEESEVDEDLQRFLESCISMVVLPATPETPATESR